MRLLAERGELPMQLKWASVHSIAHLQTEAFDELCKRLEIDKQPFGQLPFGRAVVEGVHQAPLTVCAIPADCGLAFSKLKLLLVMAQLVFFFDQQLRDRRPVLNRDVVVVQQVQIVIDVRSRDVIIHRAAPCRGTGTQPAFSSPIDATGRAVTTELFHMQPKESRDEVMSVVVKKQNFADLDVGIPGPECEVARISALPNGVCSFVGRDSTWCSMDAKSDVVTISCAVCVAGYAAIATGYVAQYGLGFSLEGIRGTSLLIAAVMATAIAIDFLGKKLGNAR